jgi:hypothetical protein
MPAFCFPAVMRMKGAWRGVWIAARARHPDQVEDYSAASPNIAGRETSLKDPCACRASVGLAARTQRRAIASLGPPRMRSAHIAQLPPIAAGRQDADEFMEDVKHRHPRTLTTIPVGAYCKRRWATKRNLWGGNVKLPGRNSGAVNQNSVNRRKNTWELDELTRSNFFLLFRPRRRHFFSSGRL